MSKNFHNKNRSNVARPRVSIVAMVSATKGRLVLAVACITAVCVASFGERDLSAVDQVDSGVRASVTLGPPSFVIPQPSSGTRNSAAEVVVTQASALSARNSNPSGKQILQLIDPAESASGDVNGITIRPRLGSATAVAPQSNANALQLKSVSDETTLDNGVTASTATPVLSIPGQNSTGGARDLMKIAPTDNPTSQATGLDARSLQSTAVPKASGQPVHELFPIPAQTTPSVDSGRLRDLAIPSLNSKGTRSPSLTQSPDRGAAGGNGTRVAQQESVQSQPVPLPPMPSTPVPGLPIPLPESVNTQAIQMTPVPEIPIRTQPPVLPQPQQQSQAPMYIQGAEYPSANGYTPIPSIESLPLDLSPHSKAYGGDSYSEVSPYSGHSVAATAQPQNFGHSVFNHYPGTSGYRATVESDSAKWMAPYNNRVMAADTFNPVQNLPSVPAGFTPWWNASVKSPVSPVASTLQVDVRTLLQDAMLYSPQVTAIKTEPEVQYRVITQEEAKFDWTTFLEATYDDLNDPVGNDLTTGNGEDRLLTKKVGTSTGIRRKTEIGGDFRLAQEFGQENQNSRFFVPNNQGSSRLELSYRQPLLDGAGRTYNDSEIVLARIQANASEDEVVDAMQSHLIEVTEAYWTLYRARA